MSIFSLAQKPISQQIAEIERGLSSRSLEQISKQLGLSKHAIISALKLEHRSIIARENAGKRFTLEESERLLRVVRVYHIIKEAFTDDAAAAEWLCASDRSLGGKTPLQMLATDLGAAKVENLARALVHGVPV